MTKKLAGLAWVPRAESHSGCLEACAKYLGLDVSPAWLVGGIGHAFLLVVDESLCPSGPSSWDFRTVPRMAPNVGLDIELNIVWPEDGRFAEKQEQVWHTARSAMDAGCPCYGWHWEFTVLNGYDDTGYLLSGRMDVPRAWREFGADSAGFVEIFIVRPGKRCDDAAAVKSALTYGIEVAENREGHREWGSLAQYENWARGLESSNDISPEGAGYHAAIWAECRTFARDFLREAGDRLGGARAAVCEQAAERYATVSADLQEVARLFPAKWEAAEDEMARNANDTERRRQAAARVRQAREAEVAGVEALKDIVRLL